MLFPALPWEPCLYYNKAQPRSFLGQTSAALVTSSLFPPRSTGEVGKGEEGSAFQRQQRSPVCQNLVCLSRERGGSCLGASKQLCTSRGAPGLCEESRLGDSPWAQSPPASTGADVIQQLFWQALSPVGKAGHASPSASSRLCSALVPGESSRMAARLVRRGFCR